ncbi:MAG: FixH family protein [Proteobacteria bacterium]|nr:FixH family protein [Pseudomonadota bacterium]
MNKQNPQKVNNRPAPWYKHAWVWFIIALPMTAVVASLYTVYVAHQNAPHVIVKQNKFQLNKD